LYYLLDDFNHQHEHTVISGTRHIRYSSTHRVARGQTWFSLRDQCETIRSHKIITDWFTNKNTTLSSSCWCPKAIRAQQRLWTELEFEWIRQWYVQGQRHASHHGYWHEPIRYMEECWRILHDVTTYLLSQWESAPEDVLDIWIEAYVERLALQDAWEVRLQDPMYRTLEDDWQPMTLRLLDSRNDDLQQTILKLRQWKKQKYQVIRTKRETRTVASNWIALQPLTKQAKR
jgi:mRNA N6-methyladenine demethylase